MSLLVVVSVTDRGEGLLANLTSIGFLARVLPLVDREITFLGIFLPATNICANELLLFTRVRDFNMVIQVLFVGIGLGALGVVAREEPGVVRS